MSEQSGGSSLQSMTGFAQAETTLDAFQLGWELRSVNGRGLDMRLRLPPGFERMEIEVRKRVQKYFSRGNINAVLTIRRAEGTAVPVVNEQFLGELGALAKTMEKKHGLAPASVDGLLAIKGVLELPDEQVDSEIQDRLNQTALELLERCMQELSDARAREGRELALILQERLAQMEKLTLSAQEDPSRSPEMIVQRVQAMLQPLLLDGKFDEQRLYQEAVLLATKADISEEIDRLKTHIAAARGLVEQGSPAGRKLDFLSQEFNREANTLCSKSNATSVTAIGLEMKTVIDQFREQVQNVE